MSISPDLFDSIVPPEMWITFGPVEPAYSDERTITVRVKPFGQRSVTAKVEISRYAPEVSVFRALIDLLNTLHSAQRAVKKDELTAMLAESARRFVEPF